MVKTVKVLWELGHPKPLLKKLTNRGHSVLAFIQARTTSSRLPNKIYKDLNGAPLLFHVIEKAKESKLVDDVIIVSPHPLPDIPEGIREFIYNGNEMDVLGRYSAALETYPAEYVVRLTSDCPLLDPNLIDLVIHEGIGFDYASNVLRPTFPDGVDVEMISSDILKSLNSSVTGAFDREHVTTSIRIDADIQSQMNIVSIENKKNLSGIKISIDTEDDLNRVRNMDRNIQ